jgi:hypothetical protein
VQSLIRLSTSRISQSIRLVLKLISDFSNYQSSMSQSFLTILSFSFEGFCFQIGKQRNTKAMSKLKADLAKSTISKLNLSWEKVWRLSFQSFPLPCMNGDTMVSPIMLLSNETRFHSLSEKFIFQFFHQNIVIITSLYTNRGIISKTYKGSKFPKYVLTRKDNKLNTILFY